MRPGFPYHSTHEEMSFPNAIQVIFVTCKSFDVLWMSGVRLDEQAHTNSTGSHTIVVTDM